MTQKAIGPTFAAELDAAGLMGLPFAWSADGAITFDDSLTAAQKLSILAVHEQHDPTKPAPGPRRIPTLEFMDRFTDAEILAIDGTPLRVLLIRVQASQEVWLDDPRIVGGMDQIVAASIFDEARKAAILA